MPESLVVYPDPEPFRVSVAPVLEEARTLKVVDVTTHTRAEALMRDIAGRTNAIVKAFEAPKAGAHNAHKFICDMEKALLSPLKEARSFVEREALVFETAQRKIAEEKAAILREAARQAEEEARLQDAILAEQAGQKKMAEYILEQPAILPKVVVAAEVAENRSATQTRTTREVTDLLVLVQHVAANPKWLHLLEATSALAKVPGAVDIPGTRMVTTQTKLVRIK